MLRIISGGQTGVDQGALAAALAMGTACGGWCPQGRLSEEGAIAPHYPVVELAGAGYRERTLRNVLDSDATAILYHGGLEGGTRLTRDFCEGHDRPHVLIDASAVSPDEAIAALVDFVGAGAARQYRHFTDSGRGRAPVPSCGSCSQMNSHEISRRR